MAVLGGVLGILNLMVSGVRTTAATLLVLPFRITFIVPWLVAVMFLLFNAPAIYGDQASVWTTALLLYTASIAFVFAATRLNNPLLGVSTAEFVITFVVWALLGAVLFKFLEPFNPDPAVLTSASLGVLVTHALVVAIGEELLFRHALPSLIPGPPMAGMTISAVVFGFMHWAAYGGDVYTMLFASLLGLLFGAITLRFRHGLIIAMALHFIWNAYTLGFISIIGGA